MLKYLNKFTRRAELGGKKKNIACQIAEHYLKATTFFPLLHSSPPLLPLNFKPLMKKANSRQVCKII